MNINCKGKLLNLDQPIVMAILNVTPDSFYDGGQYSDKKSMQDRVRQLVADGADIIDVGGMSSRPGAEIIPIEEELKRVLPAIEHIVAHYPRIFISIDTVHGEVADRALSNGAHIINDISSGDIDESILKVAKKHNAPYIAMHMQGKPHNMQDAPLYEDITLDLLKYFDGKIKMLRKMGLKDVIIDPGFGFGKTIEHNYTLLRQMNSLKIFETPLLVGLSRKSMIYKPLGISSQEALHGTSALHMVALQNGAKILRVHDVKEAKECIALYKLLSK